MSEAALMEALQKLSVSQNKTLELLIAKYLVAAINAQPLTKIRLICEAALMNAELAQKYGEGIITLNQIAMSLATPNPRDSFIAVPWAFQPTEANYNKLVKPWLLTFPYAQYGNELVREKQLLELQDKPEYEQFFIITQKQNLNPVALWQMRHEFYNYALPVIMAIAGDLTKRMQPSSFLAMVNAGTAMKKREVGGGE